MLVYILLGLGVLFLALFFLKPKHKQKKKDVIVENQAPALKKDLGQIQVFYASQTGTAAKMASTFAEESAEHGFKGVVIDLKNLSHAQFQKNQISVFFMANTGEGEPPENSVAFMKMLNGKQELDGEVPQWANINYSVFGLGDTQYEHFNKIGIDTDKNLQKLGGNRLHPICLGDANSSLQDDYEEWKTEVWPVLVNFREANPISIQHKQAPMVRRMSSIETLEFLNKETPIYANFKFCLIKEEDRQAKLDESQLDFKTKAGLLGKLSGIQNIIERRQDTKNGSSLEMQVILEGEPEYQTAGNIALWPKNDPKIVESIVDYFNLDPEALLDLDILDRNKKNKFNFVAPLKIRQLLEDYLDLQFRITKGLLKKLSKFQSKSPQYFLNNSSAKTTEEYKRLSEKQFTYLFKLIKEYEVNMCFQDFVELSDSVGPRLFTIASSWKAQKSVAVIASIVEDGLISKHFNRNPKQMKAELRKSSFVDISKWNKVIFVGAGTGFAPFRGFLQEKELLLKQGKQAPIISLYFGCKYQNSDFIYREDIMEWEKTKVIDRLSLAFSRQAAEKVYVQNLLQRDEEELNQFINSENQALYICGSLAMGKDVTNVLEKALMAAGQTEQELKQTLAQWQKSGKFIKELW